MPAKVCGFIFLSEGNFTYIHSTNSTAFYISSTHLYNSVIAGLALRLIQKKFTAEFI